MIGYPDSMGTLFAFIYSHQLDHREKFFDICVIFGMKIGLFGLSTKKSYKSEKIRYEDEIQIRPKRKIKILIHPASENTGSDEYRIGSDIGYPKNSEKFGYPMQVYSTLPHLLNYLFLD